MDQERLDVLLARCLAGELSPEESDELEWAMLANPALRVTLQVLQRLRDVPGGSSGEEEQEMLELGLANIMREAELVREDELEREVDFVREGDLVREAQLGRDVFAGPDKVVLRPAEDDAAPVVGRWRWMAAAAVLVLGVGAALLYRGGRHEEVAATVPVRAVHDKEIVTRYGTRSYQELPDGSKIWLNAGSKINYTDVPADGRRELTLTGEAFFDIRHDPGHPFIIHTGKLDIKVLGTSFNVKAYPNDSAIETTLINGKVEIDWPGGLQAGIVLRPNEKVVIPVRGNQKINTGSVVEHKMVAPDPQYRTLVETSWVEDKLVFRNEPFSDVSRKLERWYNIHISFEDQRFLQDKLTAYFKGQPIKNVMDALQISLGFQYRIDGDTIHITSK